MAIDGVAPRAKLNQQRARRFKGAKEAVDLQQKKEELLREFTGRSEINDDVLAFVQNRFDTNVITPGNKKEERKEGMIMIAGWNLKIDWV